MVVRYIRYQTNYYIIEPVQSPVLVVCCGCGCVVVWLCGCAVVWLCGCMVVWLCGCGCVVGVECGVERTATDKRVTKVTCF